MKKFIVPLLIVVALVSDGCGFGAKRTAAVGISVNSIETSVAAIKKGLPDYGFTLVKDATTTSDGSSMVIGVPFKQNEGYAQMRRFENFIGSQAADKKVSGLVSLSDAIEEQEEDNLTEVTVTLKVQETPTK